MKKILQNLKSGETTAADVPAPMYGPGCVLVQTQRSLISAGTERMLVEFSQANLVQKARQQPEKVREVLDKMRTDGLMPTLEAVFRKLDEPLPLGYCNCGRVLQVGEGVDGFVPGDLVISNGPHAEIVCVPKNLCAKVPAGVTAEQASFTVLGAIALQGIRLAEPTLGERFMVFGMGLLGLLTVQLLRATGCDVLAVDLNSDRLALAETFGAETVQVGAGGDPVAAAMSFTQGVGVDGVIVTASAKSDEIMHEAAQACRKRGRVILVGVVGLNLRRSDFYEKEIRFQVSCSYGPGRYDDAYEQAGQDYPIGFVRWTEQRNFQAVLNAMRTGRLNVDPLITDRYPQSEAVQAYDKIQNDPHTLGVVLEYPEEVERNTRVEIVTSKRTVKSGPVVAGVIGAGNFAKSTLMPALAATDARIAAVVDLEPAAAKDVAEKYGAEAAMSDYTELLADDTVNTVFILAGHSVHARLVCEALAAGKHVFVEKPLAMNEDQLQEVEAAYAKANNGNGQQLMVGFNRRFSPHVAELTKVLKGRSDPLCMTMTVNAGYIPPDHWTQDSQRGGGRIIGEACHFLDLLASIAGAPIEHISAMRVGGSQPVRDDKMSIIMGFGDGSVGTVNYFANGSKSYPKETLEVFSDNRVLRLDNFRVLRGYGVKGFKKFKSRRQDKGHKAEVAAFVKRIAAGGEALIPIEELLNTTRASFAAMLSAREEGQRKKPLMDADER